MCLRHRAVLVLCTGCDAIAPPVVLRQGDDHTIAAGGRYPLIGIPSLSRAPPSSAVDAAHQRRSSHTTTSSPSSPISDRALVSRCAAVHPASGTLKRLIQLICRVEPSGPGRSCWQYQPPFAVCGENDIRPDFARPVSRQIGRQRFLCREATRHLRAYRAGLGRLVRLYVPLPRPLLPFLSVLLCSTPFSPRAGTTLRISGPVPKRVPTAASSSVAGRHDVT